MTAESARGDSQPATNRRLVGWLFCLILLVTAAMAILWAQARLLEQDESFSFDTDSVATFADVLHVQRDYPISLEPPPFHLLAHAAMDVLGRTDLALRVPSILGFLVLQVCLYFFVRNIAGERAGLFAMAFPALISFFIYGTEGRPYGVLLGSCSAAILCWQIASRRESNRLLPLVGLAVALALTVNTHFYGVLIPIPICAAELVRALQRRKLDPPMLAAIIAGVSSLVLAIPYIKAAGQFKQHYYTSVVSPHWLVRPYQQMIFDATKYSPGVQHFAAVVLVLAAAAVLWGCARAVLSGTIHPPLAEWVLMLTISLTPVFAFLLARFVTHAVEARHSIGAVFGISALAAVAAARLLRSTPLFYAMMAAMLLVIVAINSYHIRSSTAVARQTIAELTLPENLRQTVDANPDRNLYFQDLAQWEICVRYAPDPEMRSRFVFLYSKDEELQRAHHDTEYLTALHMQHFTKHSIASYDALRQMPGDHYFALFHGDWDRTDDDIHEEALQVVPVGDALGGKLLRVQFR